MTLDFVPRQVETEKLKLKVYGIILGQKFPYPLQFDGCESKKPNNPCDFNPKERKTIEIPVKVPPVTSRMRLWLLMHFLRPDNEVATCLRVRARIVLPKKGKNKKD